MPRPSRRDSKLRCKGIPVEPAQRYYDGPMVLSDKWIEFLRQHSTPAKRNKHMTQARRMKGNKLRSVTP